MTQRTLCLQALATSLTSRDQSPPNDQPSLKQPVQFCERHKEAYATDDGHHHYHFF